MSDQGCNQSINQPSHPETLCCAVLYFAVLCCAVLCCAVLRCAAQVDPSTGRLQLPAAQLAALFGLPQGAGLAAGGQRMLTLLVLLPGQGVKGAVQSTVPLELSPAPAPPPPSAPPRVTTMLQRPFPGGTPCIVVCVWTCACVCACACECVRAHVCIC